MNLTLLNGQYEKTYAKNASNPMKKMVDVRCYVNVLLKASGGPQTKKLNFFGDLGLHCKAMWALPLVWWASGLEAKQAYFFYGKKIDLNFCHFFFGKEI